MKKDDLTNMKKKGFLLASIIIVVLILFVGNRHYNNKINSVASSSSQYSSPTQSTEEKIKYSTDNIFIYSFNGVINIFVKGSKEESNRYIGYQIKHSSMELDKNQNSSNYDIWNLNGANEYKRNDEDKFMHTANVVTTGEWELAIKEEGATDFVGGLVHGDEITKEYKLEVDGQEESVESLYKGNVNEVKFSTVSDLFRDNTITSEPEKIGVHLKEYTFNKGGLTLKQEVTFTEELTLRRSYLTMLPILRKSEGVTGDQITDTVITNYDNVEYDVSNEDFSIPEITHTEASKAVISGQRSGITATVNILNKEPSSIPTNFLLSNSEYYNKVYFGFNQDWHEVKMGEVWEQTTHYQIDTSN
jgi:hypothetical protein